MLARLPPLVAAPTESAAPTSVDSVRSYRVDRPARAAGIGRRGGCNRIGERRLVADFAGKTDRQLHDEVPSADPLARDANPIARSLAEALVERVAYGFAGDFAADVRGKQSLRLRRVELVHERDRPREIFVRRVGGEAGPVPDPLVSFEIGLLPGHDLSKPLSRRIAEFWLREPIPVAILVRQAQFRRHVAISVAPWLRPEPMQREMRGVKPVRRLGCAFGFIALRFAESRLPTDRKDVGGVRCVDVPVFVGRGLLRLAWPVGGDDVLAAIDRHPATRRV